MKWEVVDVRKSTNRREGEEHDSMANKSAHMLSNL